MPREGCAPCCNPPESARSIPNYHAAHLIILCDILNALGGPSGASIRYDWEVLCDPNNGIPVFVRWEYSTDGVVVTPTTAYLGDGSVYVGDPKDLVACSGGAAGVDRYTSTHLCDPTTGDPVWVLYPYETDGTLGTPVTRNIDGTAYVGAISDLVDCNTPVLADFTGETLVTLDQISITGAYAPVGLLTSPIKKLIVTSTLDGPVHLSFDGGTTDHAYIPGNGPATDFLIREFNFYELGELLVTDPEIKDTGAPITNGEITFEGVN